MFVRQPCTKVLRLECRARCVDKDSQAGGPRGGASVAKSAQAQVALTLKIAANRRQREIVETLQSEVRAGTENDVDLVYILKQPIFLIGNFLSDETDNRKHWV